MPQVLSTASKLRLEQQQQHQKQKETTTQSSIRAQHAVPSVESAVQSQSSTPNRKRPRSSASTLTSTVQQQKRQQLHDKTVTTAVGSCSPTTQQYSGKNNNNKNNNNQSESKNRHLFQIRVGSVVALRMGKAALAPIIINHLQPQTQIQQQFIVDLASSYTAVWTNPDPRRDVGPALVGHRIRCSFPKNKTNPINQQKQQRTVLEGEIIHVEAANSKGKTVDLAHDKNNSNSNQPDDCWAVELLIEERVLPYFPTLRRLDTYWDDANDGNNKHPQNPLSAKAKKRLALERQIQGPGTAVVQVLLWMRPDWVSTTSSIGAAQKWVIEKRVPSKLFHHRPAGNASTVEEIKNTTTTTSTQINTTTTNQDPSTVSDRNNAATNTATAISIVDHNVEKSNGKTGNGNGKVQQQQQQQQQQQDKPSSEKKKKPGRSSISNTTASTPNSAAAAAAAAASSSNRHPTVRHVGDGHDSPEQQIANWRWLAGRYHDMRRSRIDADLVNPMEFLAAGFVGQVLAVKPSSTIAAVSSSTPSTPTTLAQVTVRRLYWPEHLRCGRLPHLRRHPHWLFQDGDVDMQIQVPVEHLVMVGRKLRIGNWSSSSKHDGEENELWMPWAYSWRHDRFQSAVNPAAATGTTHPNEPSGTHDAFEAGTSAFICHRCRRPRNYLNECTSPHDCPLQQLKESGEKPARFCKSCLKVLAKQRRAKVSLRKEVSPTMDAECELLPCCTRSCDCSSCNSLRCIELQEQVFASMVEASENLRQQQIGVATANNKSGNSTPGFFDNVVIAVREMAPVDFSLPANFLDPCKLPIPQAKPSRRIKKAKTVPAKAGRRSGKLQQARSPTVGRKPGRPRTPTRKSVADSKSDAANPVPTERPKEDYSVFKPTCARTQMYDPTQTNKCPILRSDPAIPDNREPVRNLRDAQERNSRLLTTKKDDTIRALSSSRAARANQRRLMKDVASLGMTTASSLGVDALANRESQLRFDRSSIHAWGVFADEDISAGEMIVEYRGELIGNAVAERREVEYEAAKIGSDYMFRIDAFNVCDATKQGNVARFINASCDPNCYTKIITMDGTKRIVIYAKKDISVGDELCYDYKFPVEYDETRRIPCHCGARDCRGFMNWDKRYVLAPVRAEEATEVSNREQQPQNHPHRPLKCAAEGNATEEAKDSAT